MKFCIFKIPSNVFQFLFVKVTTLEYNKIKHFPHPSLWSVKTKSILEKSHCLWGSLCCSPASRIPPRTTAAHFLVSFNQWGEDLRKWVKILRATSRGCQQQQQNPSPQQHLYINVFQGKPPNTWHFLHRICLRIKSMHGNLPLNISSCSFRVRGTMMLPITEGFRFHKYATSL